ncbi:MAG: Methylated-DNA--protein-cysteine methyltransferase [Anaerolineales bacterium]|nr:Methylated-DNA--protein-cysteine methyltransferase [Anaerolineales bacterium]
MKIKEPVFIGKTSRTPLGIFWVAMTERGLTAVEWDQARADFERCLIQRLKRPVIYSPGETSLPRLELTSYLRGDSRAFSFPIDWSLLRPFQRAVLEAVYAIPYGETTTYARIAEQVRRPLAYRAVGRANATNPMPLVVPCHRVIGMDGKLRGYGGGEGVKTKEWLLKLEGAALI